MKVISPYRPRPQQLALHLAQRRFNVFVVHRRFGKTVWAINNMIRKLVICNQHNPRGAYIAPTYTQAKRVAWQYAKEYCAFLPGLVVNNSELKISFGNGVEMLMLGAEKADSLRGIYLDDCVIDETAQINPEAWTQSIRPALADRNGSATFLGTPKGAGNLFYDLYHRVPDMGDDWRRVLLKYTDTNIIDPLEIEALRREMTEDEFNQEFNCSWNAALQGSYWGKEMTAAEDEGRITSIEYDSNYPVHLAFDLGWSDEMVCWFVQVIGNRINVIDLLACKFTSLPDFIAEIRKKSYNLGEIIAPHDIRHHDYGSGQSGLEVAQNLGLDLQVCPMISVADGIRAVQATMKRVWFDAKRCATGITALRQYRSKYNPLERVFSQKPLHSWESHYADAWRMFVVYMDGGQRQLNWSSGPLDYSARDRRTV